MKPIGFSMYYGCTPCVHVLGPDHKMLYSFLYVCGMNVIYKPSTRLSLFLIIPSLNFIFHTSSNIIFFLLLLSSLFFFAVTCLLLNQLSYVIKLPYLEVIFSLDCRQMMPKYCYVFVVQIKSGQ